MIAAQFRVRISCRTFSERLQLVVGDGAGALAMTRQRRRVAGALSSSVVVSAAWERAPECR